MGVKTYQAYTMAEALDVAKRDLGANAVVLETRSFKRGGLFGLGRRSVFELTATDADRAELSTAARGLRLMLTARSCRRLRVRGACQEWRAKPTKSAPRNPKRRNLISATAPGDLPRRWRRPISGKPRTPWSTLRCPLRQCRRRALRSRRSLLRWLDPHPSRRMCRGGSKSPAARFRR